MWSKKPTPVSRVPAPLPDRPSVRATSVSPVLRLIVAVRVTGVDSDAARIEAAWRGEALGLGDRHAGRPPARARRRARRTSAIRRRKWRTLRPEAKRAAPSVGSVWFEPAT